MKILPSSLLAVLSIAYSSSQCMDQLNSNIGLIDRLMLQHAIKEKGYDNLAQEIENHQFTREMVLECYPPIYTTENRPFSLTYQDKREGTSLLSKAIFNRMNANTAFTSKNPLNLSQNSLDECTTWRRIGGCDDIQITTDFYDKAALVALLYQLKK